MNLKNKEKKNHFTFSKQNYILLAIGFVVIILGFILMIGGKNSDPQVFNSEIYNVQHITIAPMVVLLGFIIEIFAILKKPKTDTK